MNETIRAYDLDAVAYADASPAVPDSVRADIEELDPLVDDLASPEGPYDVVWANASLLHVARADGEVRSGIAGKRQESWLEVSAVRGTVSP